MIYLATQAFTNVSNNNNYVTALSSPLHFSVFIVVPSSVQHSVGSILSTAQGQVTPDPLLNIHTDL